jgi:hypothetical protein
MLPHWEATMKKHIIHFLALAFTLLFSSTLLAAVPSVDEKKLWAELVEAKANPSASKLGKWNVIENIELIRKADNVSLKATALAIIIDYYDKREKIWFGKEPSFKSPRIEAMMQDMDKNSKKNAEKYVKHAFIALNDEYYFSEKRYKARRKDTLTFGMDLSYLLEEKYLQRNGNDIVRATRDFAAYRGMEVEVIVRGDFRFDEIADFIDHQNPIILQDKVADNYLICVGYLRRGTEEYLITADPNIIKCEEHSPDLKVAGMKDKILVDMKLKMVNDLQSGVEITDWKSGNYTAYVIRNFKTTEASFEKYLKFIIASPEIDIGPPLDEEEFKKQASEWIPLGISVSDAEKIMKTKEFKCERYTYKATNNYPAYEELLCLRYGPVILMSKQCWNISLKIKDEKIVEVGARSGGYGD